jgi:hypothetical protein
MDNNIKFDKYIQDAILRDRQSRPVNRSGVIASYDPVTNTATVIMSDNFSNQVRDVVRNVTCPTNHGIQMVAPEPGRGCWVAFDGIDQQYPYIVSYHNSLYAKYDETKQTEAYSGIPRYMLDM